MLNLNEINIPDEFVESFNTRFDKPLKTQYFMDGCSNLKQDMIEHIDTSYNKEHLSRSIANMLIFIKASCDEYGIDTADIQSFIHAKIQRIQNTSLIDSKITETQ